MLVWRALFPGSDEVVIMRKLAARLASSVCVASLIFAAHAQETQSEQDQKVLRIVGAPTVMLPANDAAEILKKENNLTLELVPVMSSNEAKIGNLGENQADVAMIARPLSTVERSQYPNFDFKEIQFGEEAAVLVVSRDVWDGGVHALTKEQAKGIHEGKIKNWKEVGGPDLPIIGFAPEKSSGIWACYVRWLYDDPATIRDSRFAQVKNDDEAREAVESTAGSITPVSMLYAGSNHLHALAIKNDDGKLIQPSAATVADHSYPMARPLIIVTKSRPLGDTWTFVEFMIGDRGQQLVHKYNYFTLKELGITPPSY